MPASSSDETFPPVPSVRYILTDKMVAQLMLDMGKRPLPTQLIKLTAVCELDKFTDTSQIKVLWQGHYRYAFFHEDGTPFEPPVLTSLDVSNRSSVYVAGFSPPPGLAGLIEPATATLLKMPENEQIGLGSVTVAFCTPPTNGFAELYPTAPPQPDIPNQDGIIQIPKYQFGSPPPWGVSVTTQIPNRQKFMGGLYVRLLAAGDNALADPPIYEAVGPIMDLLDPFITFNFTYDMLDTDKDKSYTSSNIFTYFLYRDEACNYPPANQLSASGAAWQQPMTYPSDDQFRAPLWHVTGSDDPDTYPNGRLQLMYPDTLSDSTAFDNGNLIFAIPCQDLTTGETLIYETDTIDVTLYFNAWHKADQSPNYFSLSFRYTGYDAETGFGPEYKDMKFIKVVASQDGSNPPIRDLWFIMHNSAPYPGYFYIQYAVTRRAELMLPGNPNLTVTHYSIIGGPGSTGSGDVRLEIA
ncbi:hypothetical protein [Brucella sp. IR073]|uniref:hypothetical protein n=1 Tax=unclassified Brucella TaxID=2632610 RepID=UPI003B97D8E5